MSIVLDRPSVTAEEIALREDLVARAAKLVPLLGRERRAERDRSAGGRGEHHRARRGRAVVDHATEALRRSRDRLPDQARGLPRAGPRLRVDGVGDEPDERLRVVRRALAGASADRRVGRRSEQPGGGCARAHLDGDARRRRLSCQRSLELCQWFGARAMGAGRRAARRFQRRIRRPGSGPGPDETR